MPENLHIRYFSYCRRHVWRHEDLLPSLLQYPLSQIPSYFPPYGVLRRPCQIFPEGSAFVAAHHSRLMQFRGWLLPMYRQGKLIASHFELKVCKKKRQGCLKLKAFLTHAQTVHTHEAGGGGINKRQEQTEHPKCHLRSSKVMTSTLMSSWHPKKNGARGCNESP